MTTAAADASSSAGFTSCSIAAAAWGEALNDDPDPDNLRCSCRNGSVSVGWGMPDNSGVGMRAPEDAACAMTAG